MAMELPAQSNLTESHPGSSEFRRSMKIFLSRGLVRFGMVIITIFLLTAAFAPLLAPYDPYEQGVGQALSKPSWDHLLGTDIMGRDTMSRLIYGTRTALMVGVIALGIATVIGLLLGLIAGYFGGLVYAIIMRFMDMLMAFPMILLALLISAMLGGGLVNVMIALGIALLPGFSRLMCGQVLSVKENDYILAEKSLGTGHLRIMFSHILPNCMPTMIVFVTMMMGTTILAEAGLSYLGLGVEVPTAAWGSMVNDGYRYLIRDPVLSIAPGVALMLVAFSFNMVGDGLRDALDPRLRGTL
jgi:peptide/nickel transport system permease protein